MNGVFRIISPTRIAEITDGTSNTMLFSERASGMIPDAYSADVYWWNSTVASDTLFTTLFPPNPFRKLPDVPEEHTSAWAEAPASFHPGGINVAFADGSVRFLKDSVDTWAFNPSTGYPVGVNNNNGNMSLTENSRMGVFQKLATRSGGDLVGADEY